MTALNFVSRPIVRKAENGYYSIESLQAFERRRTRSSLGAILNCLFGHRTRLDDWAAVEAQCSIPSHYSAGVQQIPLEQIRGSEGRMQDFDRDFNPRHKRMRDRWLSVFNAWERGVSLPPVELIQVGDIYYVRDGHHRISVARAHGLHYIDAEVTVWNARCHIA